MRKNFLSACYVATISLYNKKISNIFSLVVQHIYNSPKKNPTCDKPLAKASARKEYSAEGTDESATSTEESKEEITKKKLKN